MTSVVVALVLVAPQSDMALGLELLGWAFLSGALYLVLDRRAGRRSTNRAARVQRFSPNVTTSAFLAIAGATFLAKHGGGLYWLLPTLREVSSAVSSMRGSSSSAITKPAAPTATVGIGAADDWRKCRHGRI